MARENSSHMSGKNYGNWVYGDVKKSVEEPASFIANNVVKLDGQYKIKNRANAALFFLTLNGKSFYQ